jgi:hypothetical protein
LNKKLTKESKINNKNQENEHQIKKKNQDYIFKDEIENKLKFEKRIKNQNYKGLT